MATWADSVRVVLIAVVLWQGGAVGTPGSGPSETASASGEHVENLIQQGRYAEAEIVARESLATAETTHGLTSLRVAEVLDLLFECLSLGGKLNLPETRVVAKRSLAIKESLLGRDDVRLATSLDNIAMVRQTTGDFEGARSRFGRSLDLRKQAYGTLHADVATSLYYLGILNYAVGDFDAALSHHEGALQIRERVLGPNHLDVSSSLNNLAIINWETGDYVASRPLYERALSIREDNLGPAHPRVAGILNNFAVLVSDMGDLAEARVLFKRALAIREEALGRNHPEVASTINNFANVLWWQGDLDEAEKLIKRALAIWPNTGLRPNMAWSLDVIGALEYSRGRYEASKAHFDEAVVIWRGTLGPDHPAVAHGLVRLGSVLREMGAFDESRVMFDKAVGILRRALGNDHPHVATALNGLAELLLHGADNTGSLAAALEAEKIGRQHLRLTIQVLSENQSLGYASFRASGLDLALSAASRGLDPDGRRDVYDSVIRSRALVLDEMAARHRSLTASEDREVVALTKRLARARTRLANLAVRGVGDNDLERYSRSVRQAREENEQAERALAQKSASFRAEQTRGQLGFAAVAESLPRDAALVSYAVFYSHAPSRSQRPTRSYVAFVLKHGDTAPSVVTLGKGSKIDDLVAQWRLEISEGLHAGGRTDVDAEIAYRRRGEELRQAIWAPLADSLRGVGKVFVVPDGQLHIVSLATLPSKSGYLVENGPLLHYMSSERDLVAAEPGSESNEGLLVIGDPAFDTRPSTIETSAAQASADVVNHPSRDSHPECGDFHTKRFTSLPAARREIKEIARLWRANEESSVIELTGIQATERNFRGMAHGRLALHVATHGFFLNRQCASAPQGSRGIGGLSPVDYASTSTIANPLTLAGLALAGANHRNLVGPDDEDGILTAQEIASLDLSGTHWAVLSACDTGLGTIRAGEGVFGLRRAFQIAGVSTVIMSLWQVDDNSARRWMRHLYAGRLEGSSTAEAVRDAHLKCLLIRRRDGHVTHPFYWGAFVAAGDWH